MPIIKSAIKRAKQAIKRHERNVVTKRDVKDATRAFIAKPTAKGLSAAHSEIDTAVKKNLIQKNTAARRKSQLSKIAKNAGVKLETVKKAVAKTAAKTTIKPKIKSVAKKITKKPVSKKSLAKKAPAKKPATKK
jgi:Ribosomal protein S20.